MYVHTYTHTHILYREEAKNLLAEFLNARKDERKEEKIGLERRLKGEDDVKPRHYDPTGVCSYVCSCYSGSRVCVCVYT